jgi:prepilin-type processing-associated H-X9-DG protein
MRFPRHLRAFARADLIASLSALSLLAFAALPLMAGSRQSSNATLCLANMRQLVNAWLIYAEESDGKLVENFHGGEAQGGAASFNPRNRPWAVGWLDWGTTTDNTNMLFLRNPRYAKLAPYLTSSNNVHKCPSDDYLSFGQQERGWPERVRTVVLNGTLGSGNAMAGPWDVLYRAVTTLGGLRYPAASDTAAFFDEHPDSINDPLFFPPRRTEWVDFPGALHQGAGSFSFADGHAELHAWRSTVRNTPVRINFGFTRITRLNDPDIHWLSYRSQRASGQSY